MILRMTRRSPALVSLVAAVAGLAGCSADDNTGGSNQGLPDSLRTTPLGEGEALQVRGTLERVVDGDTVVVDIGRDRMRVRLLGIDTPETVKPDAPVECFGPEASSRAKQLMPKGAAVRLQTDPGHEREDDFGRLLAYIWVGGNPSVNERLVSEGFATVFIKGKPFTRARQFQARESDARAQGLGLWGSCPVGRR
jgi:micrococcal nuclease